MICYPLPKDVQEVLAQRPDVSNLGLLFHKYVGYSALGGQWRLRGEDKDKIWRDLERRAEGLGRSTEMTHLMDALNERMKGIEESYRALRFKVSDFAAEVCWRLTVGLGTASVLDTGMTLHRIFGIPYIPASAVKGLTHHYVIEEKGLKECDPLVIKAFGDQKSRGQVVFLDAFPIEYPVFQLDIINPHYGPYYQGDKPPADYHSPVPVYFLTVGRTQNRGSAFRFCLASKDEELLKVVECWLKKAIQEYGVGAKTRAGYGEMEVKV